MLVPSILGENPFDEFMRDPFFRKEKATGLMKTDIKEEDGKYEIITNLPGIKKENISIALKDGYLTITASTSSEKDEKDKKDNYIRKERYEGVCSRNFYVGDKVKEADIKAKFSDGILTVSVPKEEPKAVEEHSNLIPIE